MSSVAENHDGGLCVSTRHYGEHIVSRTTEFSTLGSKTTEREITGQNVCRVYLMLRSYRIVKSESGVRLLAVQGIKLHRLCTRIRSYTKRGETLKGTSRVFSRRSSQAKEKQNEGNVYC